MLWCTLFVSARGVCSPRNAPLKTLGKCISCVFEGQVWATAEELGFVLEALAATPSIRPAGSVGLSQLSAREIEVVNCLAEGLSNREIAQRLKLSRHTIKNYMFRIFDKVGVSSRVELLFCALSRPASETGSVAPEQSGPASDELATENMAEPQSHGGRRELRTQMIGRRRSDRSLTSPKVETARDRRPWAGIEIGVRVEISAVGHSYSEVRWQVPCYKLTGLLTTWI